MENYYRLPLTKEYNIRGCNVKIDAASCQERVDIQVTNIKTGEGSIYSHMLDPSIKFNEKGYTKTDILTIKSAINELIDKYGELEWNEINSINQILL